MALSDHFRQPGVPLSLGLHGAVLVASLLSFNQPVILPDPVEAVSIEVVTDSLIKEVTKGEQSAKQAAPTPRVDRVSPKVEQNAPGEAAKQVNTDAVPKPQEATAKEERKEVAAVVPPPLPVVPTPPKPVEPPKPVVAKPPKPVESKEDEKEEEAEEILRQAAKKKLEQQKLEEQRKLAEQKKKLEEQRKADEAERKQEEREEAEAEKREQQKLADAKAAADRKKTEDLKKVEDAKKAQEAAVKAADEKRKREADQQARNQATADAARRALLASREAPSNSGNTGQQVSRTPAAGAPTATGAKLNPSDRAALAGLLADQIRSCWSVPVSGKPNPLPLVRIALGADGSLQGTPALVNSSGDPNFRALADSGMRAIRQCAPFRIPSRFASTHGDWRSTVVQLNPED
jgi:colicin import membrane protein